ncbi:myb-like protein D isoform X3 [Drosophila hydei]|uniref:Myb-like protein D isoform X2 n=1 Tax=Drosophila hydei TaxID=7224 RepID=A0A6J1L9S6_DROHY|nr:myb-like protein D isoform X2 [Drosophila hydei]XP_023163448.2 myb-like protein D isoform X3 [Drosophila hydei]
MMMQSNNGFRPNSERSSSRISIYNYPEHLNPFTEEDNHKRLRFWNFSKSNDNSKRRSFSFGNLRDVWTFRSFNLKKKSSTLGIQKTSESPPVLRRNFDSTTPYLHSEQNANQRRHVMRSLQNVSVPIGLTMGKADFDRCSTPQPQRYATIRSSYSSLSSTNPFESEIESDVNNIESSTLGLRTKTYRKKRRAPSVPTKIMVTEPQTDPVKENSVDSRHNVDDLDIKSLTTEIERFVNHSNETSDNHISALESTKDYEKQPTTPGETLLLITENSNRIIPTAPNRKNLSVKARLNTKSDISTQEESLDAREDNLKETNASSRKLPGVDDNLWSTPNYNILTEKQNLVVREDSANEVFSNKENLTAEANFLRKPKPNSHTTTLEHILDARKDDSKLSSLSNNEYSVVEVGQTTNNNISTHTHIVESTNRNSEEFTTSSRESSQVDACETSSNNILTRLGKEENLEAKVENSIKFTGPTRGQTTVDVSPSTLLNNNYNIYNEENFFKTKKADNSKDNASQVREHLTIDEQINKEIIFDIVTTDSIPTTKSNQQNYSCLEQEKFENNNSQNPLTIYESSKSNIDCSQESAKPTKAKSVKEIIDSINRSQRLLKESAAKGTIQYSTALYSTTSVSPNNNHNKREVVENDNLDSSSCENHLDMNEQNFKKNKIDKIVFQFRESSPTASNLDWNPVPKPKRINSNLLSKDINEL